MTSSGLAIATERSQRFSASTSSRAEPKLGSPRLSWRALSRCPTAVTVSVPAAASADDAGVRRVVRVGGEQDLAGRHVGEAAAEVVERGRGPAHRRVGRLAHRAADDERVRVAGHDREVVELGPTSWSDFAGRSKRRCWRSVPSLSTRASRPSESIRVAGDRRGHPQAAAVGDQARRDRVEPIGAEGLVGGAVVEARIVGAVGAEGVQRDRRGCRRAPSSCPSAATGPSPPGRQAMPVPRSARPGASSRTSWPSWVPSSSPKAVGVPSALRTATKVSASGSLAWRRRARSSP